MYPSKKQECILRILCNAGETYGWDIVERDTNNVLSKASIYIELSRMVDKGFVTSIKKESVPGDRGLPKRYYRVTGLGQRALQAVDLINSEGALLI